MQETVIKIIKIDIALKDFYAPPQPFFFFFIINAVDEDDVGSLVNDTNWQCYKLESSPFYKNSLRMLANFTYSFLVNTWYLSGKNFNYEDIGETNATIKSYENYLKLITVKLAESSSVETGLLVLSFSCVFFFFFFP